MTIFKFVDVKLINNVLGDCFGRDRLFVWQDTDGRRWAIIKGKLYSGPRIKPSHAYRDEWPDEYTKPMCWGELGTFECYWGDVFHYKSPRCSEWRFASAGLDHVVTVQPPFDCLDCKHLITIDEEECGMENGGIVCELSWDAGDSYVCTSTSECEHYICTHFDPREPEKLRKKGYYE